MPKTLSINLKRTAKQPATVSSDAAETNRGGGSIPMRRPHERAVATRPPPEVAGSLELLTVKEAAAYARVSQQTVRRWLRTAQLKYFHVGRQIRINNKHLDDFIIGQ